MRKIVKIVFLFIKCFILFIALWATTSSTVKNVEKLIYVEQFKSRGEYQESLSNDKMKFYKVTAKDDEDSKRKAYLKNGSTIYPGSKGDILVSTQATVVNPLVSGIITYYVGGHATIVTDNFFDYQVESNSYGAVEATGLNPYDNRSIVCNRSYWSDSNPFTEVIGLRVNMSESEIKSVVADAIALVGDDYNYSFLFDTDKKSYCSDIVSKAFSQIDINLNKDSFATTIYDLIVADKTYISYYSYYENDVLNVYYLG